ncbi:hypothetical protein ABZ467_35350 [Streptomyces sp. NPDC005727]|uniref:hypothetical protein n=1 Tax=Streptomyces sp. NPDC005727 TaxID=3157053 RepID=UPI00340009D2
MDDLIATVARATVGQLGAQFGKPELLEVQVETALRRNGATSASDRFADPVAVGGLIVTIATLAYQIYQDHRKQHGTRPSRSTLVEYIRVERRAAGELMSVEETIIEVVAEEIVTAADDDE